MASRGKHYTEEQIIAIPKVAAAGFAAVGEAIRRHGISPKTYYGRKAKYSVIGNLRWGQQGEQVNSAPGERWERHKEIDKRVESMIVYTSPRSEAP